MTSRFFRKIIGSLSLTSVAFVFQACYGSPQDFGLDVHLNGTVTSEKTGLPIKGIKVSVNEGYQYVETNEEGKYSFYVPLSDSLKVSFEDVDSLINGLYLPKDSVVIANEEALTLDINLSEVS